MIGDKCLALFEADQLYYDATILNIDHETRVVKVKYEGYGNEEEINLNEMLPLEFKQDMETFQVDDIAEEAEVGHGGPSTKSGGDRVKGNLQVCSCAFMCNEFRWCRSSFVPHSLLRALAT